MFEYIKGKLIEVDTHKAIIDVNGIGYKVFIPASSYADIQNMKDIFLYISYVIKEDSQNLYGFLTKLQRNIFNLLKAVSGIGAKTALLLLSHLDIDNLHTAIINADIRIISKVPGIGKKTAERLIVELKDKFKILDKKYLDTCFSKTNSTASDAIAALMNLGYSSNQAQRAVKSVLKNKMEDLELSSLITSALRNI
jgi:Holliday junction DNA helicase RuvA